MDKKKKSQNKNKYSDKLDKATKQVPQNPCDKKSNVKQYPPKQNNQFGPYWSAPEVARGLSTGALVEGVLRINQKSYEDAFICSPDTGQQDIYIKGVQARSRALNGDIVVVKLDQPWEWKVNHDTVKDFLERSGTDEDCKALMEGCVVNVKEEASDDKIKSESDKSFQTAKEVISISSGGEDVVEENVSNVPKDCEHLIETAVDPLENIPVASASDYESDHSAEDLETKVEAAAIKISGLELTGGTSFESDDEDVIVESTSDPTIEEPLASSPKKTRRGKRGKKKVTSNSSSTGLSVNTTTESNSSGGSINKFARKQPSKPLVEYSVFSVLKHSTWEKDGFVQKTGKVVAIREFKHSRVAAGTIKHMSDKNPRFFLFSPTDSRVPRMKIPMSEAPQNFQSRPEDFAGMMFVARIVKWEMVNNALGTIERSLGHSSDIAVRTEGLLLENNIDYAEFSPEVIANLPDNYQTWTIPQQELKRRRDFRDECVFTIDPLTARDLDDALSVTKEENGLYRVGVHIADVSYFVKAGTALDKVAGECITARVKQI